MKLTKPSLILATIVPLIFGVIILYFFKSAIDVLYDLKGSTYLIYDQLVIIAIFSFLALTVYWLVMMYLIYLLQENLMTLDSSLDKAADIGSKHLSESKSLLNQVINILKRYESSG